MESRMLTILRKMGWCFTLSACVASVSLRVRGQEKTSTAQLREEFRNPPDDSRIMVRWWWFGPAATKPEITRELEEMKAAGIGGVEITHLYALALDDVKTGFHNEPFLSLEHLDALRFAAQEARRLGMRVDVTLGSGWPLGGPEIPVDEAAGKLRVEAEDVPAGATFVQAPFVDQGEELIAAFVGEGRGTRRLDRSKTGQFVLDSASRPQRVRFFIASRTGMQVKRPSVGAAGFVLDHYDAAAIKTHLDSVDAKLLSAFGDRPPYAVFSDSLEDYGSDWSPKLLEEFQKRRGYDLTPHLPALVENVGPETAAVRHDWGRTLTEMADDNFLVPMEEWAKAHHTRLRAQNYGIPPVTLSSNRIVDLPEGEGKATFMMWREFSDTRWAASAGHLFGRDVISSETWTWLHSPAFRATPLDMKAEADLHFLQGINQLVGHGWPYSPESAGEPGWRMYAAAALNAHNPWFDVMPELTKYLQRVSWALRQGKPANDVAILLPNDDVWASFAAHVQAASTTGRPRPFSEDGPSVSVDEAMPKALGDQVIAQVLDAGFNADFIDADAIDQVGIPYRALILPSVDRLPVATYEKIVAFARKGGVVIATRREPATAPGFENAERDSARLKELSRELFSGGVATAKFVAEDTSLGAELKKLAAPDMTLTPAMPQVGFIHRRLEHGNLYFVANTANVPEHVTAHFRDSTRFAEEWDAFTGDARGVANEDGVKLDLERYGSRLIYFADDAKVAITEPERKERIVADLSREWTVRFGDRDAVEKMDVLRSWTEDAKTRYFSGRATYEKSFEIGPDMEGNEGTRLILDFGEAKALPQPSPPGEHNMRAYLDAPVREAAQVFVNGSFAGDLWKPPYRVDVTRWVHPGTNQLRIVMGNTAMNEMAGKPLPNYRLLWDRYRMLFQPQDMDKVEVLPSGLLGPVRLIRSEVMR
jgi:hypothetical protein